MSTLAMHHRARLRPRRRQHQSETAERARILGMKLSEEAVQETLWPVRACARYLCQGVATEDQFVAFRTAMRIAQAIELQRAFRGGLGGHIEVVLIACHTIHGRAMANGTWQPTEINFQERDAITVMVDLHELQLRKLTAGQLLAVVENLIAETEHAGGEVHRITQQEIGAIDHAHA